MSSILENAPININKSYGSPLIQRNKCFHQEFTDFVQMEHSYSRDRRPAENTVALTTRTLLVHKVPQCPSCHVYPPMDDSFESDECNNAPIPPYDENLAKEQMNECTKIAQNVRNLNPDDEEWEERVPKIGWTTLQQNLFAKIARILDLDNLARLSMVDRQHEPVQRRVIIDKSVSRFRQAFASVSWDPKITQWLHGILMEHLPPTYMAIYLDILQTLKTKLPALIDKMLFGKPMNINQELLTPVMKKQWEPVLTPKQRKLPGNTVIVLLPSSNITGGLSPRMQKWCQLLSTMTTIVHVQIPNANTLSKQPIDQVCEHIAHLSKIAVQEVHKEQPNTNIILVGFNSGASLALQVALSENYVSSIISVGFAYNTINGVRGAPDDHILDIIKPVLFVIGQNSAKTSQEEMESLRDKMQSETALVVVGSADDFLRVPKSKRQIEGVTQSMIDNMVMDEIHDFVKNCILNPPGLRQINSQLSTLPTIQVSLSQVRKLSTVGGNIPSTITIAPPYSANNRKRKSSQTEGGESQLKMKYTKAGALKMKKQKNQDLFPTVKRKVGRPRTRPLPIGKIQQQPQTSVNEMNLAIQSILPNADTVDKVKEENEDDIMSAFEILTQSPKKEKSSPVTTVSSNQQQQSTSTRPQFQLTSGASNIATQKFKMIPTNQFVQIKPPTQQNSQRIYTIKTSPMLGTANNQSQVFTVKTATGSQQFTANGVSSGNTIILNSPPKYTVLKGSNILSTGGNIKQNLPSSSTVSADLSCTNILDLPIVFADNDGNIHESASLSSTTAGGTSVTTPTVLSTASPSSTISFLNNANQTTQRSTPQPLLSQTTSGKLILSTTANSIIQRPKPNKVVYINRSTMKPCTTTNVIKTLQPTVKYTKLVVTPNPKATTPSLVPKPTLSHTTDSKSGVTTITIQKPSSTSGFVKATPTLSVNSFGTTNTSKFQPLVLGMDPSKTKNIIKIGSLSATSVSPQMKQTIVLKPSPGGGFKPFPISGINRNIAVRKVVNIISPTKTLKTTISPNGSSSMSTAVTTSTTTTTTEANSPSIMKITSSPSAMGSIVVGKSTLSPVSKQLPHQDDE